MEKIVIIGGRGTAIVIADQICDANQRFGRDIEVLGLALDDRSGGNEMNGYPILCNIKDVHDKYSKFDDIKFIYSLYRYDVIEERTNILYNLNIPLHKFINFIHPSAMVAKSVKMGFGNVFLANVVVNSNVVLGNFNTVNSLTLLGHDSIIGNNNFIAGHVSIGSGLQIGDKNFFGLNCSVRNKITIGNNSIIAMASNVVNNIMNNTIVYGNPAKTKDKLNNAI